MKLQNPWPEGYSINTRSPFGWRIHPISKKRKFHQGVDVAGSFPVTAAADGVVTKIGWSPRGGGHTVLIDHGDIVTVYYHGAHRTELKKGQRVKAGDFSTRPDQPEPARATTFTSRCAVVEAAGAILWTQNCT